LGNGLRQTEVLRAGQDEPAWLRPGINLALQVVQQFRDMLDFIENRAVGILRQEPPWIAVRELAGIQRFHGDIRPIRKSGLTEGGFAGLTRTGYHDYRIVAR